MRLNVMLEGQDDLAYADILAVARQVEALGYEGLYRSDHYATTAEDRPLASTDAWATLAGLARETAGILLGTLVSPATFRPAGNLAKVVGTVAEMAGTVDGRSRVELGLGTGWMQSEHRHYGFPFPDLATRYRRLAEHLQVVRGLWDPAQEPFSFTGEFEHLRGARLRPRPDPLPRIIIGGKGLRKTPRLAARYADELNTVHVGADHCLRARRALDEACEEVGRDPAEVGLSLMTGFLVGTSDPDVRQRAERLAQRLGRPVEALLGSVEGSWLFGTQEQVVEQIQAYADAGVQRIMLQHLLPDDDESLQLVAEDVRPRL